MNHASWISFDDYKYLIAFLSMKIRIITVAKIENPSRMPVSNRIRSAGGLSIIVPLSSVPVIFVKLTLLQKFAPQ